MSPKRIIQIVLFSIGLIFIVTGIFIYNSYNSKTKKCTEPVTATVVEINEKRERRMSDEDLNPEYIKYYYPVFEYSYNGKDYKIESKDGEKPSSYEVNEKVDLLVNPNNPSEFIVKGSKGYLFLTVLFLFFGAASIISGIIVSIKLTD